MQEFLINQPIRIPFVAAEGKTSFNKTLLCDGVPVFDEFTFENYTSGLNVAVFTPTTTGYYTLFIEGSIQAKFSVVSSTVQKIVRDIQDQVLGSWIWDKTTGELTLLRQDSSFLAKYKVIDNLESASRELLL